MSEHVRVAVIGGGAMGTSLIYHLTQLGWEDVVNSRVFLSDIRYYSAMNAVYAETIGKPAPPRATVGTQLMSPEALVEIQMLANRPAEP